MASSRPQGPDSGGSDIGRTHLSTKLIRTADLDVAEVLKPERCQVAAAMISSVPGAASNTACSVIWSATG